MRGAKETRECAACGKPLTRLVSQYKGKFWYCDNRCQASHAPSPITQRRTVRLSRTCRCGAVFETYPSVNQRFCSYSCSAHFEPKKPKTGSFIPCPTCGTDVWVTKSLQGRQRFCSKACQNASQSKEPVVKPCEVCGTELRLKPSQAAIRTCSMTCRSVIQTKRPIDRTHNGKPARLDQHGYVLIWEPGHAGSTHYKGWAYEHRVVAAQMLGRPLRPDEHVDHINRLKDDNRPENLQVLTINEHARKTGADTHRQSVELVEYRRRYGPLS